MEEFSKYISLCFHDVPTSVSVGLFLVSCLGGVLLLVFLGWRNGMKWSTRLLMLAYLILLFLLAVGSRSVGSVRSFSLTPFWSYRAIYEGNRPLLIQAIMNVLAFVPVGVLLGCSFSKMKWWKVLLIGGSVSVTIEVLQLAFKRGFAEFDDVFHNVSGCMIGYGIYVGLVCVINRINKRDGHCIE